MLLFISYTSHMLYTVLFRRHLLLCYSSLVIQVICCIQFYLGDISCYAMLLFISYASHMLYTVLFRRHLLLCYSSLAMQVMCCSNLHICFPLSCEKVTLLVQGCFSCHWSHRHRLPDSNCHIIWLVGYTQRSRVLRR